jgi:REP element-mobilizing transposase RayT
MIKDRPNRLDLIYINQPLCFVTFTTRDRRAIPSLDDAQLALQRYARCGIDKFNVALGRYVIMPDHVHFFCRPELGARKLSEFIGAWKSWTSRRINALGGPRSATAATATATALWQREFFDHCLRPSESYSEKWNYVFDNPVRAGLVSKAQEWRYAGEIETLML